jgi:plastocyanin
MPMKGVRALASGTLVLGLCCAIPAISAAQDAGTTTEASTTTTATTPVDPAPPAPSAPAAPPEDGSAGDPRRTPSQAFEDGKAASPGVPAAAPSAVASAAAKPKAKKAASASVSVGDNFFAPASVTVAVGDSVTWNNNGQAPHSATADDGSFDTGVFDPGGSRSTTFDSAGTFSYYCTVHGQAQSGTVRVLAASGGGGGGGGGAAGSSSSGSATSEASAVASPDAAGDANTLPMTGMAAGGLALVGFGLLALGLIVRQADRERSRLRWLTLF